MKEFRDLLKTIKVLRSPQGCPWDRSQRIDDMKKYLLEETYELLDAIDRKKTKAVSEELGDIFLILMVMTEMFRERGKFNLKDVLSNINKKLIVRHPHVFSGKQLATKEEVLTHWIKSKAKQKKRRSVRDRLPHSAPALLLASIFFKECANITQPDSRSKEMSARVLRLQRRLTTLKKRKDKGKILTDIIMDICDIAACEHIDLEGLLRVSVIERAGKTSYQGPKK